jgi:uncharacterized SAM-binding protein YcdF (DUF218 family)
VAAATFHARGARLALACGGRSWAGEVEADAIARMLRAEGVPGASIARERCSLDTRDNARFAAAMLARRGIARVVVITCAWHLPRALCAFRAAGLAVEGIGVEPPPSTLGERLYRRGREALASWNDGRRAARPA